MRSSLAKRMIKCWSRRLFAAGSRAFMASGRNFIPGVRILTYHRVVADTHDPFSVSPRDFRQQMELVATTGRAVDLGTALKQMAGECEPVPRIVLTFDDGTRDFLTEAFPVLLRLDLPAVIYVNPSRLGSPGFLAWHELRELLRARVQVGSHCLDHVSLGRLERDEVRRQLVESRRVLEDCLGQEVKSLAYPYGTMRDFNERVRDEVKCAGYLSACTSINGVNALGVDPLSLRRTKIEQGDLPIFSWILEGSLDGWSFFDKHLAYVQSRYV